MRITAAEQAVCESRSKRHGHLDIFRRERVLEARTPRAQLPDGPARLVEPPFAGKLAGFTLLFEAPVRMLAQRPLAAMACRAGVSPYPWHLGTGDLPP
ncbi:MAG: hypothetical protein HYZ20_19430 [Burkholderiales bacterium]|nr:hypothetical protein [Burkholderiales bacterium]